MSPFDRFNVQAFRPPVVAVWRHFRIDWEAKLLHDDIDETGFAQSENQSFRIVGLFMFGSLPENRVHELHLRLIDPTQPLVAPSVGRAIEWSQLSKHVPRSV